MPACKRLSLRDRSGAQSGGRLTSSLPAVHCRYPTIRQTPLVSGPPDVITARTCVLDREGIAVQDKLPPYESNDATTLTGGIRHCEE